MDAQPFLISAKAFLAWSMEQPEGRHYELPGGRVFQMGPQCARHVGVKGEMLMQLHQSVREGGRDLQVFPGGMAVRIGGDTVYEPDAAVRCLPRLHDDAMWYDDPVIVVEVSRSVQGLDTAGKLAGYFKLPSLQHYLILDADRDQVIHSQRDGADIRTRLLSSGPLALDPPGLPLDVPSLFV